MLPSQSGEKKQCNSFKPLTHTSLSYACPWENKCIRDQKLRHLKKQVAIAHHTSAAAPETQTALPEGHGIMGYGRIHWNVIKICQKICSLKYLLDATSVLLSFKAQARLKRSNTQVIFSSWWLSLWPRTSGRTEVMGFDITLRHYTSNGWIFILVV